MRERALSILMGSPLGVVSAQTLIHEHGCSYLVCVIASAARKWSVLRFVQRSA